MKVSCRQFLALVAFLGITACNQNPSANENALAARDGNAILPDTSKSNVVKTLFKEGRIDVKITTPGTALGELLQNVDPTKGDVSGQMKALAEKLSPEEKAVLEAQSKKAGMMNLAILMLPLKSAIFIKGEEATAKFDALTFHGENTVNEARKAGLMYVKSQNSSKAMTISYTGDSFDEMAQNELKAEDYNIEKTDEISNIAGYACNKSVYTLKKPVPNNNMPGSLPAPSIYRLEVWTSENMPKSVNFLHPLYIKEGAGIMKILIQYEKDSRLKIMYEFTNVENRAVTVKEMEIMKTEKVHDFAKDKMTVGMQMMGIVLGM